MWNGKKRKKNAKLNLIILVFLHNVLDHSQDAYKTEDRLQQNSILRWYYAKKKDDPKRQENAVAGEVRGVVCFLLEQFYLGLHCLQFHLHLPANYCTEVPNCSIIVRVFVIIPGSPI